MAVIAWDGTSAHNWDRYDCRMPTNSLAALVWDTQGDVYGKEGEPHCTAPPCIGFEPIYIGQ